MNVSWGIRTCGEDDFVGRVFLEDSADVFVSFCVDDDRLIAADKAGAGIHDGFQKVTFGADRSDGRFTSTRQLVEAHLSGDPDATRIWLRSIHHLAAAITSFINSFDPEVIILGGGIARAGAQRRGAERYRQQPKPPTHTRAANNAWMLGYCIAD